MAEVFVVDDVPQNLQMVMQILSERGLDVSVAVSGENALEYLSRQKPDLILLDISMPGMDGFTVCQKIKADPATAAIPVIFLTAKSDTEDVVRGFDVGAVDYVRKPFIMDELLSRVFTHLELKRSYERIQEQARQLETANAQKDRLFSIVAHDLRNPLSGFVSITELLQTRHGELPPETIDEYLTLLKESSEKLANLLENLLTWARLQLGALTPVLSRLDIPELLEETADLYRNNGTAKGVTITVDDGSPVVIYADREMVFTVFRNLVANAVKYTNHGDEVRLRAESGPDGSAVITVADTGIGMNQERADSLFETGATRSHRGTAGESGTGLGLLLSRDLLSAQGGDISVESAPGVGTTFRVTLPVSGVETDDDASFRP